MAANDTSVTSDTNDSLVGAAEVAQRLAITRTAVRGLVDRGELAPVQKMPGRLGMYLFDRSDVEALAAKRAAALEEKLAALRAGGAA